ncbi:AbfB domain-containing protein [Actinokineospora pegani]|uniref:AbfB domain-containing protein n=1 Tax=Actinokineospora pegani TaxID=2654637 RepID=UPI0012E99986|nr:AbfB domain-containing protein [Actinokineospora pegani]
MNRRLRTAVLALLITAGTLTPITATAEPAPARPQAVAATTPQSTQEDKARAMQTVGLLPDDALLVLPDKGFVIALWRRVTGSEVRAAAELAFSGADGECTQFIKYGLREARDRDQANQIRDAAIARANRDRRARAAAAAGIVAEPELLIQSDRDFTYALYQRAAGPRVKQAALVAFGATPDAQRVFLETGVLAAHAQDQQEAIDADQQATEAERARLAARDARARAAAVLAIVATDQLKDLSDDNFLREIYPRTPADTEVRKDTLNALLDNRPAVWKAFIDTGIHDAVRRDILAALRKKAEEDRRTAQAIIAKAEASLVHPALVTAGRRALAGSDTAVDRFVRLGQWEALTQSLRTTAHLDDHFVEDAASGPVVTRRNPNGQAGTEAKFTWKIAPGLSDGDCHSLESVTRPGHYLAVVASTTRAVPSTALVRVEPSDTTAAFASRATWCSHAYHSGVQFVSEYRTAVQLKFAPDGRVVAGSSGAFWSNSTVGALAAQWAVEPPGPNVVTAITLRMTNDDPARTFLGNPTGPETVEATHRWRQFEHGRVYWSPATGVHYLSAHLLSAYLRVSGPTAPQFGLPTTDDRIAPDGRGRYLDFFPNGTADGSLYFNPDAQASYEVHGKIKALWTQLGGLSSYLKYPTSDEFEIPGGRRSTFQGGWIDYHHATGQAQAFAS